MGLHRARPILEYASNLNFVGFPFMSRKTQSDVQMDSDTLTT